MSSDGEAGSRSNSPGDVADELREFNERLVLASLRERELFETAEREREGLTALLTALHEGVVIVDRSGHIVMLNEAARRIMGLERVVDVTFETVGNLDARRLDMTYLPAPERPLARAVRGEGFVDAEMLLVVDGEVRRVMTSCTSTADDGDAALAIVVFRNLTERHRVQECLAQTSRLAAIGTLAAGVAHEINNPLAYVMANIEQVIAELQDRGSGSRSDGLAELVTMLLEAQVGAERIRKIVKSLKTFARPTQERRTVVDVRSVINASLEVAQSETRHRARVVKQYGPVPFVDVDEAHLGHVFVNLLVNAAHAVSESNAPHHEIRVITSTARDGRAVVEIRDTGSGISEDALPHVFDPFFTMKDVGSGTGLGLSVCRNIVLALGGEITVESALGRGATFRVVLPASTRRPETASAIVPTRAPSRRAVVLIVDDEPAVGVALQRILRAHDVTVVTSAGQALALLATGRTFDVILSDLVMPEKSGMDLYDELARSSPEHIDRVVFVTGGAFTPAGSAFLERVPNERIQKPFDATKVLSVVSELVEANL